MSRYGYDGPWTPRVYRAPGIGGFDHAAAVDYADARAQLVELVRPVFGAAIAEAFRPRRTEAQATRTAPRLKARASLQPRAIVHKAIGAGPAIIRKAVAARPLVVKEASGEGLVTVLASTTGLRDTQGDVVCPGAFANVIERFRAGKARPKVVMGHEWNQVAGRVTDLVELLPGDLRLPQDHLQAGAGALRATLALNLATQIGRDTYSNIRFGAIDEYSIGFTVPPPATKWEDGSRQILDIDVLYEISPVLAGASPMTATLETKATPAALPVKVFRY